ncbi:MAG: iron ABC transporter permease [Bacteroidales bacterium]|nr:iron ABC transporter permease [Bacteroidales bacterium]
MITIMLIVLVLVFFILNLLMGSVYIPVSAIIGILTGSITESPSWMAIILQTRLPMALTALFAGSALGVSGLMMQTLFRNPLAGPSVLGVSAGASLGVAVVMMFIAIPGGSLVAVSQITGNFPVVIAAFAGAFSVLLFIGVLAARFRSNTVILIMGIMIAYAVSSVVGILQFYSLKEDLQAFVIWGLGSFGNVSIQQMSYFIPLILVGLALSSAMIKPLNLLLLGESYAKNLGLKTRSSRTGIIVFTGLLTATVTAYCGPIAFLGLAVPHLTRNLYQSSDHRIILPGTILTGALLALVCNIIARLPGFDSALPINAITSLIGAPVVIWLIIKRNDFKSIT